MRLWIVIIALVSVTIRLSAWGIEIGTLRGFVLGTEPGCAYDNWTSHITEGIVGSGYNDYGPSWYDPQSNGFGHFTFIPSNASGDATLARWRSTFTAAVNQQWPVVDSILVSQNPLWNYELVELLDTELNRTFYVLRERLDSSYFDNNVDSILTDDVTGSFRNGWGLFVFNPSASFPKLNIEMPHPEDDYLSVPVGLEMFIRTDALVMMIAGAGREVLWDTSHAEYTNTYSLSDPSRNCRLPFAVCHEVLYDMLNAVPTSPLVTVQQHSYDSATHPSVRDVQCSAFADDNHPNPPLRDLAEHLDLIHFLGETPVQGLPGYPGISATVGQYVGLWSSPAYAFFGANDTIPILSSSELAGAASNCEGEYSHQNHDPDMDPENFIHVELDEYPDQLWNPPDWHAWLPGLMPPTLQTFQLVLAYFNPYITALDSALRYTYLYPDTVAPVAVQVSGVIPVDAITLRVSWLPQAVDRFFDSYMVYYDSVEVMDTSPYVDRNSAGQSNLRDYATTNTTLIVLTPPAIDHYHFAVSSRDIWGNRAVRSASAQMAPGPYVILNSAQISDVNGGNGNGLADFGENITLTVVEQNVTSYDAFGVKVRLSVSSPHLTLTDSTEYYGAIPALSLRSVPGGFAATVSPDVADSSIIPIIITATDTFGISWPSTLPLFVHAGRPVIRNVVVKDGSGNQNGLLDPGETDTVNVTIQNAGSARVDSIVATLSSDDTNLVILQSTTTFPSLSPGQTGVFSGFILSVSPDTPPLSRAICYLTFDMNRGRQDHLLFELPIGGFSDRIENGQGSWTHYANQAGWNDQWHISVEQSHSPTHSWKCGDAATGNYLNHLDAALVTPIVPLTGHQELRFWHWMQSEVSVTYPDSAYDGGILEISVGGGPWEQLIPAAGYNKHIRCTAGGGNLYSGPFTCRIPCFGGTIPWSEVVCDLGAYSGDVQIRFRFGTDNGGGQEGWYVDDVRIIRANDGYAPQNLQAQLDQITCHLQWLSPPAAALAGDLQGYNIYRDSVRIGTRIQSLSYDDDLSPLPAGDYTYLVTAQYTDSESVFSNPATITWDSLLAAVSDLRISFHGNSLFLIWTPVNAGYYIVLSSDNPGDFTNAVYAVVDAPPYVISNDLLQYTHRFYVVIAARP